MKQKSKMSSAEAITRYIFSSKHYARTTNRIRYNAFMPKNGETSIFLINNLDDEQIWYIGETYVAPISSRTLLARGDLESSDIYKEGLEIKPDTTKHKLHANIIGWPLEKPEKVRYIAMELAENAQLHLKP